MARPLQLSSGAFDAQGDRPTMEDTHVHIDDLKKAFPDNQNLKDGTNYAYYAIFDGHGGRQTAELAQNWIHTHLLDDKNFLESNYTDCFLSSFKHTDGLILKESAEKNWTTNGCTVATCLLINNTLYTANLGDAEVIMADLSDPHAIKADVLTEKHKPTGQSERERIKNLGGIILFGRIFGTLAVSRSLGDAEFKEPKASANFVSYEPFVSERQIDPEKNPFIVLACDGLWDVCKYQDIIELTYEQLKKGGPDAEPGKIAELLVKEALKRGTQDNVSVVVVLTRPFEPKSEVTPTVATPLQNSDSTENSQPGEADKMDVDKMDVDKPPIETQTVIETVQPTVDQSIATGSDKVTEQPSAAPPSAEQKSTDSEQKNSSSEPTDNNPTDKPEVTTASDPTPSNEQPKVTDV